MLDEKNPQKSRCIRCNTCDGFACLVGAKSDAQVVCIDEAIKHSNVSLLTNSLVKRLETDSSGREIKGVLVERNGSLETYSADIVVVSCGAINSALLLLRSANDKHPKGLANGSDVVGRHYMRHNNSAFMAISRAPNPTRFQKTLALNDYYFRSQDWEYPLGHIQMLGKSHGDTIKAEAVDWAPWAPEMPFDTMARHSVDFWLTSEDLPDPANRVRYERDSRVVLDLTENNMEGLRRLQTKLKGMLTALDMHHHFLPRSLYLGKNIPIGGTAHQAGTIRFGTNPKTS